MTEAREDRRSFTHVRALMAHTVEGLIAIRCDGTIRLMNEAAQEMLGLSRSDVVGNPVAALRSPALVQALDEILSSGSCPEGCSVALGVDGRDLRCSIATYEDEEGCGLVVAVHDETELTRVRKRSEAILASTGDGLIVYSADGRITFVNPAAGLLLARDPKELVDTAPDLWSLFGLEPEDRFDPGSQGSQVREVTVEEPTHRIIDVRTDPVIDDHGHYLGFVATLHDVTAEREIGQMKNEFVSTVSHELRTPLTSIKGYVDLILDGEAGEVNEIQTEFLGIVKENSDRLVDLINDLLDISRIESGRIHLKVQPLDVAERIRGAVDTFRAVLEQQDRTITVEVPDGLPRVAGDPDRVGQVLINFISNAIKYSPEGGSIWVRAAEEDGFVRMSVTDEGIGIAEEDMARLFTKFYRVDSKLTREIGGTGLGLSIVKSIIELLGGEVGVTSEAGAGSTFWFTLPQASPDLVRTPTVDGPSQVGGTVLVVDTNTEACDLIQAYLTKQGYDVLVAHDSQTAFELAVAEKPSAITLDVLMDSGDGFDLLRKLKDTPMTAKIPVVVLSIICDEGKSQRMGATGYLEKPIDRDRLVEIIEDIVGEVASPLVMVVDDDRRINDLICNTLKSKGFAVVAAYDGREAMVAVRHRSPDLVLLDLRMPVMDGYEVLAELKSDEATHDIPVVIMTAYRLDQTKADILRLAADQIAKPIDEGELVQRIAEAVAHAPERQV